MLQQDQRQLELMTSGRSPDRANLDSTRYAIPETPRPPSRRLISRGRSGPSSRLDPPGRRTGRPAAGPVRAPPRAGSYSRRSAFCRRLRRSVVSDMRSERGHQHERAIQVAGDLLPIGLHAGDAAPGERKAAVGQQADLVQQAVRKQRLVGIQLEVARHPTHADRCIVTDHLGADHVQRLGLGRVHLAGHDRAARLIGR